MEINNNILRKETIKLLKQIESQIEEIEKEAQRMGVPAERLRDSHGNWAMSPMILAKVQAYAILIQLQSVKK